MTFTVTIFDFHGTYRVSTDFNRTCYPPLIDRPTAYKTFACSTVQPLRHRWTSSHLSGDEQKLTILSAALTIPKIVLFCCKQPVSNETAAESTREQSASLMILGFNFKNRPKEERLKQSGQNRRYRFGWLQVLLKTQKNKNSNEVQESSARISRR